VAHYTSLRDQLITSVMTAVPDDEIVLTGHPTERLPHHASFALKNMNGNDLLMHLDMVGVCASSGSACKTGDPKPSAILETIGLGPAWTTGGLRFTVGSQNTPADIEHVIQTMPKIVEKLHKVGQLFLQ
jgi:cysteine desulfurase